MNTTGKVNARLTVCHEKDGLCWRFSRKKRALSAAWVKKPVLAAAPVDVARGGVCDYSPPPVAGATFIYTDFGH
jgi:hypothetical protein